MVVLMRQFRYEVVYATSVGSCMSCHVPMDFLLSKYESSGTDAAWMEHESCVGMTLRLSHLLAPFEDQHRHNISGCTQLGPNEN